MSNLGPKDSNAEETKEWLASLEYILENEGVGRANFFVGAFICASDQNWREFALHGQYSLSQYHSVC